jgi:hypothetical protein
MAQIHWVGGNLPQIGKSWTVRALTESLFIERQISSIVVDTSPNSPLSLVYNPDLLKVYHPSTYFTGNGLAADEIFDLADKYHNLVIELSSHSQPMFLQWVNDSGILSADIRHYFWFVSNGHRDSVRYFRQICECSAWELNWVRNCYGRVGIDLAESDDSSGLEPFKICDLPGIISNPIEIDYIEASGEILHHLSHPQNSKIPLLTRTRINRFLAQSCQNFLGTDTPAIKPPPPPRIGVNRRFVQPGAINSNLLLNYPIFGHD